MAQRRFQIIADSCCDYPDDGRMPWLIRVPLTIRLGDRHYVDNASMDCLGFLADMAATREGAKSACPSPGDYAAACDCDAEDIYIVTLSSPLSGSYNSALLGAELAREQGRGQSIHVFDSHSAASGEVAICLKLHQLASAGLPFDEVVAQGEAYVASLSTLFVLEDLSVLHKAGRLSRLQALATSALHIRLLMCGEKDGTIGMLAKALSTNRALNALVHAVKVRCAGLPLAERRLVITYTNCRERAETLLSRILAECPFNEGILCRSSGISTMYASDSGVIVAF